MLSELTRRLFTKSRRKHAVSVAHSAMLIACLSFSVGFTTSSALADSPEASLNTLEMKFFQHTYPKDTSDQRLGRIEKLVFGEAKTGAESQRLGSLMQTVPADGDTAAEDGGSASTASSSSSPSSSSTSASSTAAAPGSNAPGKSAGSRRTANKPAITAPIASTAEAAPRENVSGTKYPAVTAIEQKTLHKSYENEPIEDRLARLETKMFGKPQNNADLIDRVDHLRNTTGVDVAARPPGGSDWTDEDDDMVIPPSSRQQSGTSPMASAGGEDGMSFSGRDLRKDMQRAFGGMATGGGGGSYGMGSSSGLGVGSGSYGFGGGNGGSTRSRASKAASGAPNYAAPSAPSTTPLAGMGLTQQVAALENEIFGKTYGKDTLPGRLVRLETTVFPTDKTAAQKALPERVNRLIAAVPISKPLASAPQPAPRRSKDPDFDDDEDMKLPTMAPQRSLGSLMNQMNSLMSNSNFAGGYQVPAGNMATDPSTGLLIDRTTGNLIDPSTGMVIGRRVAPSPYAVPPVYGGVPAYGGMPAYGGGMVMPPFNSGFSPNYGGSVNYGVRNPAAGMRGVGAWP